ncbi:protein NBR1, partial [Tanacetum coccineum]
ESSSLALGWMDDRITFKQTYNKLSDQRRKKSLDLRKLCAKRLRQDLQSFVSHVDFTMTYVDEDGDAVYLDTDNELHEAVRQNLNPVRITIKLNRGSRYSHNYHNPLNNCRGNTYGGGGGLQTMPENMNSPRAARWEPPLQHLVLVFSNFANPLEHMAAYVVIGVQGSAMLSSAAGPISTLMRMVDLLQLSSDSAEEYLLPYISIVFY